MDDADRDDNDRSPIDIPTDGWLEYSRAARELADLRRAEIERDRHLANLRAALAAERARLTANLKAGPRRGTP